MIDSSNVAALNSAVTEVIGSFHVRMRLLEAFAETQLAHANKNQQEKIIELVKGIGDAAAELGSKEKDAYKVAKAVDSLGDSTSALKILASFSHGDILAQIIFVSIFSSFDAFLNKLLRTLYSQTRIILELSSKQVLFGDVFNLTRDAIIDATINSEIDSLLRDNYSKIFDVLATRFNAGTLKDFKNWQLFVESSQRRHLITHCDGIVNKQYIDNCKSAGVRLGDEVVIGHKLGVSKDYLVETIKIVTETGLKLGQVLWRTSDDQCVDGADAHLGQLLFELLKREEWIIALRMGEFSHEVSKRNHKRPRKELSVKIILINYAQAAKWSGDRDGAMRIVNNFDWSGSAVEFRMAVACLKEEWDNAAKLMAEVGNQSELCPIHGYIGWPIFREFRKTNQFTLAFKSIFGVEYIDEAKKAGDEEAKKVGDEADLKTIPESTGSKIMPIDPNSK